MSAVGDEQRREQNRAAVERAFAGVSAADAERQLAEYTDDLVLELPFTDPPRTIRGRDDARDMLSRAFETYRMTLSITEWHDCLDPDELVVEFVSEGHMTTTGRLYANRYIAVMRFRDGRICAQREFFNPKLSDAALGRDGR